MSVIEKSFESTINSLKESGDVLIVFSVNQSVGEQYQKPQHHKLNELGLNLKYINETSEDYRQYSYIGVLKNNVCIFEKQSKETVYFHSEFSDTVIKVISKGANAGNRSSIVINDYEYSPNRAGLNIVVFDYKENKHIRSFTINFQKSTPSITNFLEKPIRCQGDIFPQVMELEIKIDALTYRIQQLEQLIQAKSEHNHLRALSILSRISESDVDINRQFFEGIPAATGSLRVVQLAHLELLRVFDDFCIANDIEYWIAFGTLLGATRGGRYVPWDVDVDAALMRSQLNKLYQTMPSSDVLEMRDTYRITKGGPRKAIRINFKRYKSPFIDLFIYDECDVGSQQLLDEYTKCRKKIKSLTKQLVSPFSKEDIDLIESCFKMHQPKGVKYCTSFEYVMWGIENPTRQWVYNKNDIFPLKRVKFEDILVYVPNNSDAVLRSIYGNYTNLPDDIIVRKKKTTVSQDTLATCDNIVHKIY